jgi:hypothetical protein
MPLVAKAPAFLKLNMSPSLISGILLLLAKVSVSQNISNYGIESFFPLGLKYYQFGVVNHKASGGLSG